MVIRSGEVTNIAWGFVGGGVGGVGNEVSHISSTLHHVVIMAQSYYSLGC